MKYLSDTDIDFQLANIKQLTFEVTDACNLKCNYCGYGEFYEDYDSRDSKMLPVDKAIRLIDYLAKYWNSNRNISLNQNVFISFYGGEPLLNMDFIKKVVDHFENEINNSNRHFSFSMTTNALLLHKYMDYLHDHDFHLLISLDGNENNNGYRVDSKGLNAFNKTVTNVNALQNKYPEYFINRINFNSVLHNKNSVEDIYNFFKVNYNKIPSIGELNNTGIRKDKVGEFIKTYKNTRESLKQSENYEDIERDMFIKSANYQSVNMFLYNYSGFVFTDYTDLLFEKRKIKTVPTGTCIPFSKKMFVTVNGKILPCERIGHQFALGEITDTDIILDTGSIADKYNKYYAKIDKQCSTCKNVKACIQCIFNLRDIDNPICYGFMNEDMFNKYVNSQMNFLKANPGSYEKLMKEVIIK